MALNRQKHLKIITSLNSFFWKIETNSSETNKLKNILNFNNQMKVEKFLKQTKFQNLNQVLSKFDLNFEI